MSQTHPYHSALASETKLNLSNKLKDKGISGNNIFALHEVPTLGGWTYFRLLPVLNELATQEIKWFLFMTEVTEINFDVFEQVMAKYNSDEDNFVGNSVTPPGENKVNYPNIKSGFMISKSLSTKLQTEWEENQNFLKEFSWDAIFNFATAVKHLGSNAGPDLKHEPKFCTFEKPVCAMFQREIKCHNDPMKSKELLKQTLFAVKTFSGHHKSRLSILKRTWTKIPTNLIIVSDKVEPEFGTVVLEDAGSNTNRGHCYKTQAILRHFAQYSIKNQWRWLVITDDDTMLGVAKLIDLIQCYDKYEEFQALGERWGFRVNLSKEKTGQDYLAGGGGMIFNKPLVDRMTQESNSLFCKCPTPEALDDVFLGFCLANLGVPLTHSDRFHQGRPEDYNKDILEENDPISFHHFYDTDPIATYSKWFKDDDEKFKDIKEEL